ncbi:Protein of unknown function (DUF4088) [Paraburkholderia caribensis MBA4]|uniref:Uncharacterized protein n=1 Tax=Paraburkholderia caribensis MBA4 TaxID=1323664 RepID=A0A0P0RJP3_9BURK|nr:Protein of unknown function (DUF4088) [Paraburkholderia caribensis MBA4]
MIEIRRLRPELFVEKTDDIFDRIGDWLRDFLMPRRGGVLK